MHGKVKINKPLKELFGYIRRNAWSVKSSRGRVGGYS